MRIICYRGRPVSSVGISPTVVRTSRGTVAVGGINAVGTHLDYRRLGLSTLALEDAHATMRSAGLHVGLLSTGIANFYRKLGWERAGRQRTFTFDRRNVTYLPEADELDVTDDWRPHVERLCALHDADGIGAQRDPARFELLALRKTSRVFVGRRRGEITAYAALNGAAVREYGGAVVDVAGLLRHLFPLIETLPERSTERTGSQAGQYEMTVLTPATGAGLPELLLRLGVPVAEGYQGMLKILDAPALFRALRIDARIEPRADHRWRLLLGDRADRALDLTDGELVKLVFGPERRPDVPADVFPVEFFQWPMDRV